MKTFVLYATEDQEKLIQSFIEANHIAYIEEEETLPDYVLKGIDKGREDIAAGRFTSYDDFKARLLLNK